MVTNLIWKHQKRTGSLKIKKKERRTKEKKEEEEEEGSWVPAVRAWGPVRCHLSSGVPFGSSCSELLTPGPRDSHHLQLSAYVVLGALLAGSSHVSEWNDPRAYIRDKSLSAWLGVASTAQGPLPLSELEPPPRSQKTTQGVLQTGPTGRAGPPPLQTAAYEWPCPLGLGAGQVSLHLFTTVIISRRCLGRATTSRRCTSRRLLPLRVFRFSIKQPAASAPEQAKTYNLPPLTCTEVFCVFQISSSQVFKDK